MYSARGIDYLQNLIDEAAKQELPWEGSADAAELAYLTALANRPKVKLIFEIGFNAGFSSYAFLSANPLANVYSFDLGEYSYTAKAKEYIETMFPRRHNLILGNSLETVPAFHRNSPAMQFDLIFVDGGHDYQVVKADLANVRLLAKKDSVLVIDDLVPWKPWGEGPTKAWLELKEQGMVIEEDLKIDGKSCDTLRPPGDRAWARARFAGL